MQLSNLPANKFPIPFGASAGGGYINVIPQASQIGITPGAASLTDGFPPVNFLPVGSGGIPPFGQDMNGILFETTAWTRWYNAGGMVPWDSVFSAAIGGYPQGALVSGTTAGQLWLSIVDNNITNPNTGGAGWLLMLTGGFTPQQTPTGLTYSTTQSLSNNVLTQSIISTAGGSSGIGTWTTGTFTFTRAGVYAFAATMNLVTVYTGPANCAGAIQLRRNNVPLIGGINQDSNNGSTSTAFTQGSTSLLVAAIGDTLTVFGQAGSSSGFTSASISSVFTTITPLN